jgi:hypothetical protein
MREVAVNKRMDRLVESRRQTVLTEERPSVTKKRKAGERGNAYARRGIWTVSKHCYRSTAPSTNGSDRPKTVSKRLYPGSGAKL